MLYVRGVAIGEYRNIVSATFKFIFTNEMVNMIVSYTNKKATAEYEKYNKKYSVKNSSCGRMWRHKKYNFWEFSLCLVLIIRILTTCES